MKTNKITRTLAFGAMSLLAISSVSYAGTFATMTMDGDFSDWDGIAASYTDANEGFEFDIDQIFLANNDTHLFIRITYHNEVNPNSGNGLFLGFDNDSNAATGYDVYGFGVVGTEGAYQNDFPFEQAAGQFNTGATADATIGISPYFTPTFSQEFSISRSAIIDTANNQLLFPNEAFDFVAYFNDTDSDLAGVANYTFVPEPANAALGLSVVALGMVAVRRRRKN